MVIWIIGLSAAGKTSIGRTLHRKLRIRRPNVVFLDGDDVRTILGGDLGHSLDDRRRNAWRICRLCKLLDDQGIDVVCAILSMFHETQRWNREHYSRYFEVYLDVPREVLASRDIKGLYGGDVKNVAGVDLPFHPPPEPDLVLDNSRHLTELDPQADLILAAIERKFE